MTPTDATPAPAQVLDHGTSRFRPRARLLKTIGAELISSETVAIIELVRNSYDADARQVDLYFDGAHDPDAGRIELRDDGHGMERAVLLGPWLEPATQHKAATGAGGTTGGHSPGGRRQLGSKGVGRFAAQRLGHHLDLFTREGDTELHAVFNWRELSHSDRYLSEVEVDWRQTTPHHFPEGSGTALVITGLQDSWDEARFERLRIGLSRLVSPTLEGQQAFSIRLHIDGLVERIEPAIVQRQAMYALWGRVEEGSAILHYKGLGSEREEVFRRRVTWHDGATCGPFQFHINAWDLDKEALNRFREMTNSHLGLREYRRSIREVSGISLYRDGFRILPYGEPDNDWLRLDRRRVNNPTLRLSNNQLLGWIQLSADTNPLLQDQTNREGLVTNEGYNHLQEVVLDLITALEKKRFEVRRSLSLGSTRKAQSLPEMFSDRGQRIGSLMTRLRQDSRGEDVLDQLEEELSQRSAELADSVQQYASLAAVGQVASLVIAQLRHPLKQIASELKQIQVDLGEGEVDPDTSEDIGESLELIQGYLADMNERLQRLDPLAVARRNRRTSTEFLHELLQNVLRAYDSLLGEKNITVAVRGHKAIETTPSVVQQVTALLLDNAIYWLEQQEKSRLLTLQITDTGFIMWNNGAPISADVRPFIFDAHFSTRPEAAGMGLPLVRDLLASIGGRIQENPRIDGAEFEVVLVGVMSTRALFFGWALTFAPLG